MALSFSSARISALMQAGSKRTVGFGIEALVREEQGGYGCLQGSIFRARTCSLDWLGAKQDTRVVTDKKSGRDKSMHYG